MSLKILLVVQLLCATAVFGRTAQDVINDFEPVFQERHNQFTEIQTSFETDTIPLFESYANATLDERNHLLIALRGADEQIVSETNKYLEETGMISQPEKIVDCTNGLKTDKSKVQSFAEGAQRLCDKVSFNNLTAIENFYQDIMTKLNNEHKILEVTREECIKLKDPFDVQTCVINDLYTFYLPYIVDVKSAIKIYFGEISTGVEGGINRNEACFGLVKENVKSDVEKAVDDFKVCVWFAIGTKK